MFVLSRNVSASYRVIATLVTAAFVLWTLGAYSFAQAANITSVSDLLSDSSPSAASNHTLSFTMSSTGHVVASGGTIAITYPAGFNLSTVVFGDVDLSVNGANQTVAAAPAAATWGAAVSGQTLTFTAGSGVSATSGDPIVVKIGTNATGGTHQIVNPNPTAGDQSFEINISAGTDSGHTRVVVLNTVLVTAQVNTTFDFTVNGLPAGVAVNGTTTTDLSSSTTIPFGSLVANQIKTIAQNLTVSTNAIHGFVVTVQEDQHLLSSTGADIDNFVDGTTSLLPAAWAVPSNNISNENTWGHWGVTTDDHSTTRGVNEFATSTWAGVSTTPQVIFAHTGSADGATKDIGSTTVGYQVEITPLQEAGDDYSTVLTYIATPTF